MNDFRTKHKQILVPNSHGLELPLMLFKLHVRQIQILYTKHFHSETLVTAENSQSKHLIIHKINISNISV